ARPDLAGGADGERRRTGAAAIGRGPFARRRPHGALCDRSAQGRRARQEHARQRRRRDRRAGGAGRRLQGVRTLHGAEIFSTKRAEIQSAIEGELKPRLAADGVLLRNVQIGKIDLPADYRKGMEELLAEELAGEKMKYTLDLKEKQVKETELKAQAEKVRREIGAEAAAREQVIAARAQEEAMKHVLPFKQRQ